MTFGSLFAGIGGIDLGLERAGMKCVWQVEIDKYCQRVLAKHWPDVRRWDDVRTFPPEGDWGCDFIAGGFPCQDISNAGRRAGIGGARSGLWGEFARIIGVLRPRYVLVENVDALAIRGLDRVLGDLAALGFDAEWDRIPAAAVGAPHRRWRLFIVAYANGREQGRGQLAERRQDRRDAHAPGDGAEGDAADATVNGRQPRWENHATQEPRGRQSDRSTVGADVPDSASSGEMRLPKRRGPKGKRAAVADGRGEGAISDAASRWSGQRWRHEFAAYCEGQRNLFWPDAQPPVCGVADGVPNRVDRLRGLGNAVVPQVAEWIGRRIMEADSWMSSA